MNRYAVTVNSGIKRLEKQLNKDAAFVDNLVWYEFLVAPSCPPDKRVHIHGGNAWSEYNFDGSIYDTWTPAVECDFEDFDSTQLTLNFTNAHYYLPIILCYYGDWIGYRTYDPINYSEPVFDCPTGEEVETAAEAEAQIDAWLNGYTDWAYYRFPLRGIVFKNDGQTGIDYAILPIDAVNRGRSYLYRDARARNNFAQ